MRAFVFLFFVVFLLPSAYGQGWEEDDVLSNRHVGLRLGIGQYGVFGGELKNPRPKTGFQAGLFWYGQREQKKINWQTGLEVCLMGSNFKNEDSFGLASSSNYTQLGIIQIEAPLLLSFRTAPYSETNYSSFHVGFIPAGIVSSVIYVGEEKVPYQQNNLDPWKNLPMNRFNLQGTIGYQFRGGAAGYNIRLKASILSLNDKFELPGLLPVTGTGKPIRTWGLEFGLIF
ncbi:MAG: hypothetical protein IT244_11625 [Bacteroidia bacterium]|nr:hypothetical protein [Bacteroidia bacterium]